VNHVFFFYFKTQHGISLIAGRDHKYGESCTVLRASVNSNTAG